MLHVAFASESYLTFPVLAEVQLEVSSAGMHSPLTSFRRIYALTDLLKHLRGHDKGRGVVKVVNDSFAHLDVQFQTAVSTTLLAANGKPLRINDFTFIIVCA